ncbi:DciA family protein [Necropsobacter massiliensis]|uniref:DciA family protein n=1 Tax=Necropsobacter massiliensis TaxID=1400001 RepID=UPI000595FD5F|nr:DciA family protein [Necropsobacter massiliensis]
MKSTRYHKPVNVQDVLEHSELARIMQQGLLVHNLNEQIQRLFPEQFKGLYRAAHLAQDKLFIDTANGMVRQGLLFRQQELLALVQRDYPQVRHLIFKINPELARHTAR